MSDSHLIRLYHCVPVELRHSQGGVLRLQGKFKVRLSLKVDPAPDLSDLIEITKSIVDSAGQEHCFATTISAYELWDSVTTPGFPCLGEVFFERNFWQKCAEHIEMASDLTVQIDDGIERVFLLQPTATEQLLFHFDENNLYAKLKLIRLTPDRETSTDNFVASISLRTAFYDQTETFEILPEHEVLVNVLPSILMYHNHWTQFDEDGEMNWGRSDAPKEIVVTTGESGLPPQAGVDWMIATSVVDG